ncbi:hypothetical protein GDO78_014724 [Eleutherodactylus coqui]|uniref:Uncharacterized protein n=1 Tax=Eleutherodactylus coqui TaxID=57060 RepID=A0A8J6K2Q0_ELECQ|nr:hypothetical protein GDO78_014724 [Eleutherodactylus coqui]
MRKRGGMFVLDMQCNDISIYLHIYRNDAFLKSYKNLIPSDGSRELLMALLQEMYIFFAPKELNSCLQINKNTPAFPHSNVLVIFLVTNFHLHFIIRPSFKSRNDRYVP